MIDLIITLHIVKLSLCSQMLNSSLIRFKEFVIWLQIVNILSEQINHFAENFPNIFRKDLNILTVTETLP